MLSVLESFSTSYAQARVKFLEAAAIAGLPVTSHCHPRLGRDGEVLALDVALDGAPDAHKLLIVSSACHGVEGYCGSGVQVFVLHDAEWRAQARAQGVAVLYVHALNPYGFSHVRRTTHENVDLNRNFQDFSQPLPVNEAYRALRPLLLPDHWPPDAANAQAVADFIATKGMAAFQAAITRGQHEFPEACSLAARRRPGATRRCARCCVIQRARPVALPGSIYTPASDPAVWASAYLPAAMTPPRWRGRASGGAGRARRR